MVYVYNILIMWLKEVGFEQKKHLLDNECSQEYKDTIVEKKWNTNGFYQTTTEEISQKKSQNIQRPLFHNAGWNRHKVTYEAMESRPISVRTLAHSIMQVKGGP